MSVLRAAQRAVGATRAAALLSRERELVSPPCALCGGSEARLLHRLPAFSVLACVGCGLARTWPAPQAGAVYEGDEVYLSSVLAEEARFRRFYSRALQLLVRAGGRGRLLDVGSSVGLLLAEAQALGFDPVGVEPNRVAVAAARERGLPVCHGRFEDAGLPPASFDVLVFSHVLEHLPDPVPALQRARALLRPGGRLLVVVPVFTGLVAQRAPSLWVGWCPEEHVWQFSPGSLRRLLAVAGFRVVAQSRTSLHHPLRAGPGAGLSARGVQAAVGLLARSVALLGLGDQLAVVARLTESPGSGQG